MLCGSCENSLGRPTLVLVRREQAEYQAAQHNREHPERGSYQWLARRASNDEWSVVRVSRLPGRPLDPLKETIEAKPRPPQPDDPRPGDWQRIPPYG